MSYWTICWLHPTASSWLSWRQAKPVTSESVTGSSLCKLRPLSKFHTCSGSDHKRVFASTTLDTPPVSNCIKITGLLYKLIVRGGGIKPWWCHSEPQWSVFCGRSPVPCRWVHLLHEHSRSGAASSLSLRPTETQMSQHVQSPPVLEWSCTEHRWGQDHFVFVVQLPFLHPSTIRPLLFLFWPDWAAPGSLCMPPLNETVQLEEGSATGRGSCRVQGSDLAAGRGNAGRRFSDSDGWKCPKPSAPDKGTNITSLHKLCCCLILYDKQLTLCFLNDSQHLWSSWRSAQQAGRLQHPVQWCGDPAVSQQDVRPQIESTVWLLGHNLLWPSTAETHYS